jgi:hypothetical protein
MGPSDFGENGRREGTFPFGQACPNRRKEKTNREKTKVATVGIE